MANAANAALCNKLLRQCGGTLCRRKRAAGTAGSGRQTHIRHAAAPIDRRPATGAADQTSAAQLQAPHCSLQVQVQARSHSAQTPELFVAISFTKSARRALAAPAARLKTMPSSNCAPFDSICNSKLLCASQLCARRLVAVVWRRRRAAVALWRLSLSFCLCLWLCRCHCLLLNRTSAGLFGQQTATGRKY